MRTLSLTFTCIKVLILSFGPNLSSFYPNTPPTSHVNLLTLHGVVETRFTTYILPLTV